MKKYILLYCLIFFITSCDVEEGPFITDYNSYVNPNKKVIIEDFTGHKCPNCPDAAREMDAIHNIYGNQIIGLAIHVSSFAKPYPSPFIYDFRTEWGDNWDDYYGISEAGLPRGMINRTGFEDNTHKLGKDEWADAVALELKKEIDFKISIVANTTSISVTTEVVNNITNSYNIVICLAENNIINWQKDGVNDVEDYEHNHVLRSVITDESLSANQSFVSGEIIENSYPINLDELEQDNIKYSQNNVSGNGNAGDWESTNMNVIAYIYDISNYEILQVKQTSLIAQ